MRISEEPAAVAPWDSRTLLDCALVSLRTPCLSNSVKQAFRKYLSSEVSLSGMEDARALAESCCQFESALFAMAGYFFVCFVEVCFFRELFFV